MTTHRVLQICSLLDTLESQGRTYNRCASNLASIRNTQGAGHYLRRAIRVERIAAKCRLRLESAA